jgi:hypothetical protein
VRMSEECSCRAPQVTSRLGTLAFTQGASVACMHVCRAMAILNVFSGYSYHLSKGGKEEDMQKVALFVAMMKNAILDPASGALGRPLQGAWSGAESDAVIQSVLLNSVCRLLVLDSEMRLSALLGALLQQLAAEASPTHMCVHMHLF